MSTLELVLNMLAEATTKHIVILNGDGTQKVKFESSNNHFNILELNRLLIIL